MAEMKLSFVFFLLLCGMAVCQMRNYIFIDKAMNWSFAQGYCRGKYIDLASISTDEENQRLKKATVALSTTNVWLGLYRVVYGVNIWQWSDGEPSLFLSWAPGQPDNAGNIENCGSMILSGLNDANCALSLPFFCSWKVVLVKDNKTWEEALDYCRKHYTGLASPISIGQPMLAENITVQTQTVSVWIGLRFVNGQWVWVNSVPLRSQVSLPSCPTPHYSCGAHNTETAEWENRDCNEELNFLCYWWWVTRIQYS